MVSLALLPRLNTSSRPSLSASRFSSSMPLKTSASPAAWSALRPAAAPTTPKMLSATDSRSTQKNPSPLSNSTVSSAAFAKSMLAATSPRSGTPPAKPCFPRFPSLLVPTPLASQPSATLFAPAPTWSALTSTSF